MLSTRLLLVRHATTAATRAAAFPATTGRAPSADCEPLDAAGRRAAAALRGALPSADRCWASHASRAQQTAAEAGFEPTPVENLAECDFGRWAGATPAQLTDDTDLPTWYADPDTAPHGGETFVEVRQRAAAVLARAADLTGTTVAFSHGGLIKAAVLEALALPTSAVWQIDAAPASVTELHHTAGRWRLVRLNWTVHPSAGLGQVA